jgi:hypothetical protein
MALSSPGVEVTIIDQSNYLPATSNSVPLIVLATAKNKANAAGTAVASGTTAANAGKAFIVTSQKDIVALYGNPFFYKTTSGTPIQGYELNEYGLLAAYSLLETTNRCYVLRADIDLASLVGQVGRPKGNPADGTYWLDTTTSNWGIYEFNSVTGKFSLKTPIVITNSIDLAGGYPLQSLGNVGSYAVNAIDPVVVDPLNQSMYFFKNSDNNWVQLGTKEWKQSIPAVVGSNSNPTLTAGQTFTITVQGGLTQYPITVAVPSSPENTVAGIAAVINNLGLGDVQASVINGKLNIFFSPSVVVGTAPYLEFSSTDTVLTDLGITATIKYYPPEAVNGTSAQMPLWTTGQNTPHPTGSVWIKTSIVGNGMNLLMSKFNTASGAFVQQPISVYSSISTATVNLDTTGGKSITAGTTVAVFDSSSSSNAFSNNVYFYSRLATGPTVVKGTVKNPVLPNSAVILVVVSSARQVANAAYTVTLPSAGNVGATEFCTAWAASNIPNTTATVATDGSIALTHTLGGEIGLYVIPANNSYQNVLSDAGLTTATNSAITNAPVERVDVLGVSQYSTTGAGTGAVMNVQISFNTYNVSSIVSGGSGYQVGDFVTLSGASLGGATPTNNFVFKVMSVSTGNAITSVAYVSGTFNVGYVNVLSNWKQVTYTANEGAPFANPLENTNWYYSAIDQVDIMINQGGIWKGYREVNYDSTGHPITTGTNATDPNGPLISATTPTTQSDGTVLVYGDLWIDTSDLENYPLINRWQLADGVDQWVRIDNTDQVTSNGVLFADARWADNNDTDPVSDPFPTIKTLLTSNYLDLDAPSGVDHPQGMLLWNTRRSGYNVKQFRGNYFNGISFPDQSLPFVKNAWVSVSGLKTDGSPYMGRKAQRAMVVKSLKSVISTNMTIREEDNYFNMIACPGYPELQPEMVGLNNARNNTAYIVGDTPFRLPDDATAIQNWANNAAGAAATGEDGLVTRNEYMGLFYPSGISTDLTGAAVAVPPSHMILRTFLRNDTIAYPWLAPAGTKRGTIDNATNIGYIDGTSGEFVTIKNRVGIRDVLYTNFINPIAFFTNVGFLNYGNKSSKDTGTALDRINVGRLVAYIREKLQTSVRPFVFEPNDAKTRSEITGVVQTLFVDLVAKRGLYDYLVVCDGTNNTPAVIDRSELRIDIAIEPVKAAEFIYIPVRVLNTGEIAQRGNQVFA